MGDDERQQFDQLASSMGGGTGETSRVEEQIRQREQYERLIGRLDEEQFGRALIVTKQGPERVAVTQTDTGFSAEAQKTPVDRSLIGYVLPLSSDNSSHLVLMIDGTMLKIDPAFSGASRYKERFSPNNEPIDASNISFSIFSSLTAINYLSAHGGDLELRISEKSTDDPEPFVGYLDQAVSVAQGLKEKREAATQRGMALAINKLTTLFNSPSVESPQPPPAPPDQRPQG